MSQSFFHENLSNDDLCPQMNHGGDDLDRSANNESTGAEQCCLYCGEDNPHCLAMCVACSGWFCNGGYGTSGSHIILHMVKRRHRAVRLHSENLLGDSFLECYVCRSTNVFSLGFMPSKEESVVVLVCREPCLHSKTLRDLNWDSSTWLPLIEERRLLSWICKVPNAPKKMLTLHDITTLELGWNSEENIIVDNDDDIPSVPLHFKDGDEYKTIFSRLIAMDSLAEKERKELTFEGVSCKLQKIFGKRHFFLLKQISLSDAGVRCGDYATICIKDSPRFLRGVVIEIEKSRLGEEEVVFRVEPESSPQEKRALNDILNASTVNFRPEYDCSVAKKMFRALHQMVNEQASLSAYLYFTILGQKEKAAERFSKVDFDLPVGQIPKLNPSQENAVRKSLKNPLTLIQGPPGTGKTSTCVALVCQLHKCIQSQILVCAPSNVAVDQLAERIAATGLKTVRVQAGYRDVETSSVKHLVLETQVADFIKRDNRKERLRQLHALIDAGNTLSEQDAAAYFSGMRKIQEEVLSCADVICCTCVGAGDARLGEMRFKHVLIDEATQATEPETIIPLVRGAKQVFLVGDHYQLRPVVFSSSAEKAGLRRSLFERLLMMGHKAVRLDVQYRMHPALSLFPSNYFYEGTLQNGVTEEQRNASTVFPWPDPTNPIFFYNTTGSEELGENGSSYLNRSEAALTEQIVTRLIRDGKVKPNDIGVITPYRSQCRYMMIYFARCGPLSSETYDRVEVSSVDAFQGREKEFIIFSCVRSNHRQGIGFVVDWRRLNVSLTRAKRGIIVMGNVQLLSRYKPWHAFLRHLMKMSLVVDGSIDGLVPSRVVLQKPRNAIERDEAEEGPN